MTAALWDLLPPCPGDPGQGGGGWGGVVQQRVLLPRPPPGVSSGDLVDPGGLLRKPGGLRFFSLSDLLLPRTPLSELRKSTECIRSLRLL